MPGHAALEGNHMTCLALLLRHGADLETKNHNQETLLQCIMKKYGQTRTEKLLEESGNKLEGGGRGVEEHRSSTDLCLQKFETTVRPTVF